MIDDKFIGGTHYIIGASSGIGKALAIRYNELGAYVILSSRNEVKLKEVQKELPFPEQSDIQCLDLEQHW